MSNIIMSNTFQRIQTLINQIHTPKQKSNNFSTKIKQFFHKERIITYTKIDEDLYMDSDGDVANEFYEATPDGRFKKIFPKN
jgi:hypothetical protein